jgi:hypothetical protein
LTLVSVLSIVGGSVAQNRDYYFTVGYSQAHPMGMGGAFTAIEGGLSSIHYNPATFRLANIKRGFRIAGFANPVASISMYSFFREDSEKGLTASNWWDVARVLPKAVVLSTPTWEFALLGQEELESRKEFHENKKLFEADNFFNHVVHTALLRIRLADQVHIGGTLSQYTSEVNSETMNKIGSSYGFYVIPSPKLGVGIVFMDIPAKFKNIRLENDRIEDETVNIGVAYHLLANNTISLDVRNMSEENRSTTREWHVGLEQGFWKHIYLRSGFYRDQRKNENHFSFGAGLVNLNFARHGVRKFVIPVLAVNYALRLNRKDGTTTRTHFLSLIWGY